MNVRRGIAGIEGMPYPDEYGNQSAKNILCFFNMALKSDRLHLTGFYYEATPKFIQGRVCLEDEDRIYYDGRRSGVFNPSSRFDVICTDHGSEHVAF